jgi:NADPH2:quinone reductase
VRAAALNFFDTLIIRGKYQHKPELPFSPGGELAGEIERLGPGVTGLEIGQRVMAHVGWNGCREKAVAKARAVVPVPAEVSNEVAAGVTITYGTAMHGLKDRGRIAPGETVAVLGASGGAGLAAVEIAKGFGARVIAVASSPEKLAVCDAHGADDLIDYSAGDLRDQLKAATGGRGVDIVYDCVGGNQTERALRALAWEGRLLVIGFASGDIPQIPLNLPLLKGCSIVGVMFGRFAELFPEQQRNNMRQVLGWCAGGTLKPHVQEVMPLDETIRALKMIEGRNAVGKIVVRP